MSEWCFAHPWMTFFIVTGALSHVSFTVRAFARRKKPKR